MMEAAEILSTARSSDVPSSWVVLPLRRRQVGLSILGWIVGTVMGLGLFIGLFLATWPDNFEHGAASIIVTGFFLALLVFTGIGSFWLLIRETMRLFRADRSIIVITPYMYCKQDGDKIDLVPLEEVGYLTTKGTTAPGTRASWATYNAPKATVDAADQDISSTNSVRRLFTFRRRNPRGPTSVSFIDLRTDKRVMVTDDHSYAHPFELGATLSSYVEARMRNMEDQVRKR
ncbi:MAG TPA: hypothetical protein VKT82_23900 [Ktedonobacterales bacterium]|nr:hypothetical protein [Ktedonobacterales bacterium]